MKKKTAYMMITTAALMFMTMHAAAAYTPGTYDAAQSGIGGDITLHVTFSEEEITDITADHNETAGIGADAIEVLIDKTLEAQAVPADTIAGATVSSTAYINALKDTIEQAGGDASVTAEAEEETAPVDYVTEADLIVVGGGAAGMTAAVTASENGAAVVLLEKSSKLGGNTPAAANGVNAADSKVQLADEKYLEVEAGVEGLENLQLQNELAREELVDAFATNSGEMIDWLSGLGLEFGVEIQEDDRNPVQNYYMLKTVGEGATGATMTKAVQDYMDTTDVTYYLNVDATELMQDETGAVTGVVATDANGDEITFTGKAVLIATGGFGHNQELLGEVNPKLANATTDEIAPTTGEGLLMAQAVGAKAVDLEYIQTFPVVMENYGMVTPNKLPGGFGVNAVIVNDNAERFTAEGFEIGDAILEQPEGNAYMIFREDQISEPMQNIINGGFVASADTAAELGEALGLDGEALQATVDAYNEDVADGTDDAFGKQEPLPLEGTLYGFKYGVGAHYFMGGILINEKTQVLDENENPIEGLYAAGEVTGGFHGSQRIDGSGIGDSFTFGRIAGREIAAAVAE
ncbi:MAG: flavocytochrome c [Lachnospiraceae bacterium]|nr:flavocytochrome c [Lachnospiraceae bacterium]